MTEPVIEEEYAGFKIVLADELQITELGDLFIDMYNHFFEANGITNLPENGFQGWIRGYGRARLISRAVYICYENEKPVGMIEGQIKIGGPLSGLGKLGHTAHLFVKPEYRRAGLAKKMYQIQQSWFLSKGISNETLEVVCGNRVACGFWSAMGFKSSFINMIKTVDGNTESPVTAQRIRG